jgi:mevalonate kinase
MTAVQIRLPGKIMLAGEYAVLRGGACVACTLEPHLEVRCAPQAGYRLTSSLWTEPRFLSPLQVESVINCEPFAQAVHEAEHRWGIGGAAIEAHSQLPVEAGLGSSSALRGGVLAALAQVRKPGGPPLSRESLIQMVTQLQRVSQRYASGYDIATQVHGGLLWMIPATGEMRTLTPPPERFSSFFEVWAGGKGAPTGPTIHDTLAWLDQENRWARLLSLSQNTVESLVHFFADKKSVADLLQEMGAYRTFFVEAPHFPTFLSTELDALAGLDESWSYKTMGAGGEDSLLLMGTPEMRKPASEALQRMGWHRLPGKLGVAGIEIKKGDLWQPMFT